jgi:hypothetical protein
MHDMNNLAARLRARRANTRTRKAVARAIETAASTSVRHELIHAYQARQGNLR